MTKNESKRKINVLNTIIVVLSIVGIFACIIILFPQTRLMIMDFAVKFHKETSNYDLWLKALLSYAMGGICFILFFDYCTLTNSGKTLVQKVKQEIKDCLSEIDFRSFVKPVILLSGVYLLGILTIIRANFLYRDDVWRAVTGHRIWYDWSRYITEFSSIIVHGDPNITDISPLPQLLAVIILSVSSVLLVYIVCNRKITVIRLLASIPLGLSPFFLECLSFKFDAPYMALSILACIIPFLFITRRKAFIFYSILSLQIMCMTFQASAGVYMLIVVILCFQYWNSREKTNKEILLFLGTAAFSFCLALLLFNIFLMKPVDDYVSNTMHPVSNMIPGVLSNINNYIMNLNHDLGIIWKIGIVLVLLFFVIKSISDTVQKKLLAFFFSILFIGISFILSYGVYSLLTAPLFSPRALLGFGVFLAIMCIYIVSDYKKIAVFLVISLNWCFLVFAFSYGNALADQARYAEFRISTILHDLSSLHPNADNETLSIQISNSIDYAPTIKNISKHYPIIETLIPKRLDGLSVRDLFYFQSYFNFNNNYYINVPSISSNDYNTFNLPVALDSYYHTIKSDGTHILILLKH